MALKVRLSDRVASSVFGLATSQIARTLMKVGVPKNFLTTWQDALIRDNWTVKVQFTMYLITRKLTIENFIRVLSS